MKKLGYTRYLMISVLAGALLALPGCAAQDKETIQPIANTGESAPAAETYTRTDIITSADEAKQLLVDGNKRFTDGKILNDDLSAEKREKLVKDGQHPFAIVVSCSDSRVPPEVLFDQALGDVFVVRSAGNIVDPIGIGSVEYGAEHLKAPLIVVMGHEKCGAVKATVEASEAKPEAAAAEKGPEGSIPAIVAKIKPSVDKAKATGLEGAELAEQSATENVKAVMADLEKSPIVKKLIEEGKLKIVGAKYHLGSGQVEWLQ